MFTSHIRVVLRTISRERLFSVLNIAGLAAALTCTALIGTWVWDEWRRDRFFTNADNTVRVSMNLISGKEAIDQAVTSVQVGPNMQKDYPEVTSFCRLYPEKAIVNSGTQAFFEEDLLTVDSTFFHMFDYALQHGDPTKALTEPYTIVLTETMAKKYFGHENPVGQVLTMNLYDNTGQGRPYRITGVLKGAPRASHFDFQGLISFATFFENRPDYFGEDGWYESAYFTYLLLNNKADLAGLQAKMPGFFQKYLYPLWGEKLKADFTLQPVKDIYLHSDRRYEIGQNGNIDNLYIFGTVGLLILFVAGINYVNMATARASKRARNVGVRKALGAQRSQLAAHFLIESVLTSLSAAFLALLTGYLLQPVFEFMTDKPIGIFDVWFMPWVILLAAVLLGLGAGAYPAFILSGFKPVTVLKGYSQNTPSGGNGLRQGLVVLQFVVSIALIISVLVVKNQMNFINQKDLGFEKDALMTISTYGNGRVANNIKAFQDELSTQSALIRGLAVSNVLPVGGTGNSSITTVDNTGKKIESSTYRMRMDEHYAPLMGLSFLAGRNFDRNSPADWPTDTSQNYILNAAAVAKFGWETPEKAIGKPFKTQGKSGKVVGIVEDFNYNSLKHKVEPLCIHPVTNNFNNVLVRIDMSQSKEAIALVETTWKKHFPDALFNYAFLDEKLMRQYQSESRFGSLFSAFSLFSVLIACLGLIGLAAYTAERRTKEIGIRKVLGATVLHVTGLLTKEFLTLVLIAIVIASPIAYYFMDNWLSDFAYRIEIQGWMFAAAGALALLIAFLTVGFQSVRAALANPVKSLRSE